MFGGVARWCDVRLRDDWTKSSRLRQVCEIRIKKSNKVKCIVKYT